MTDPSKTPQFFHHPGKSRRLIQNAVKVVATGEFFKSTSVHDFVALTGLPQGLSYFLDGGCDYQHIGGDLKEIREQKLIEDYSLYDDDPFETIAAKLLWKTYGPKGDQPGKHVPLKDCTLDHLKAIRDTQRHIGGILEKVVWHWIEQREKLDKKVRR